MKKIKKKWVIISAIVLIAVGYFSFGSFLKKPSDGFLTEKAVKGQVLQNVSETGSVKATENASLSFKSTGRVARINVAVGDNVKKGDILAELDLSQSSAQLQNAKAALEAAKSQYDKLINGLTQEDIKTYQDAVTSAKHDLQSAYDSALNTLGDAYTKIYNSYTTVASVQNSYFGGMDQSGIKVSNSRVDINSNMQDIKIYIDAANSSAKTGDIDAAISHASVVLGNVYNDLKIVREQCDEGIYYAKVSAADKASLDDQKGYINAASTDITDSQQSINSYKIALQKAEDNLALKIAVPRPEDINVYKSEVDKAQANVNLYQSQVGDAYLITPIDGKVTEVDAKRGEVVSASVPIVNLLSLDPFQVKVNIYEQEIVNVKQGDSVIIDLVAFPRKVFLGKVLSINPGEKIVDNVVYYEVTIDFPQQPEGIRSGMTADIVIETSKKDDVLRVTKNAVVNIDGRDIVQVIRKGKVEDREITLGLEGNDYYEVVSGLSEGEEVVTGKK